MRFKLKSAVCILLCLSILFLNSCVPSWQYLRGEKQGIYPKTEDFPNTKWVCNEIDLSFYMFAYAENTMSGIYTVDNVSYRVVAGFDWAELNFNIYSDTTVSVSEYSDSMVHRVQEGSCAYIYTSYTYDKATGSLVCSLDSCESVNGEVIPETLTFYQSGSIAQKPSIRWEAEEIPMFLEAYSDTPGYFQGEIIIDGVANYVHAIEIGNNYYQLSIENGKINNLKSNTTSVLIHLYFDIDGNRMIAKIDDEILSNPVEFTDWSYGGEPITFKSLSTE